MEFFVPSVDGSGPMPPDEAEAAWLVCRKGAEHDLGTEASDRRIRSVRFVHEGGVVEATVGEKEPFTDLDLVMAIIEIGGVYMICSQVRGYMQVGGTPMVGRADNPQVVFFDA